MNKEILDRALNLIKKTGDKVIIVNSDNDDSYAVMALRDYEKMAMGEISEKREPDLTVSEPQDKIETINREIAILSEEEKKKETSVPDGEIPLNPPLKKGEDATTESQFYFEPVE